MAAVYAVMVPQMVTAVGALAEIVPPVIWPEGLVVAFKQYGEPRVTFVPLIVAPGAIAIVWPPMVIEPAADAVAGAYAVTVPQTVMVALAFAVTVPDDAAAPTRSWWPAGRDSIRPLSAYP